MYRFVDCQSFAGGFTLGMVQAGFQLVGKREMKGGFGAPNCEANRHLLGDSWSTEAVHPAEWTVPEGGAQVVAGNPPCSGFSVMSSKSFRGANSTINTCMWAFVEYAAKVRPEIAIFESVQLAAKEGEGRELMRSLRTRLEERTGDEYHLYHVMHNAYSVGGAAQRKRYFWLASKIPFGIEDPAITRYPLLNDIIGDLESQPLSMSRQPYQSSIPSWWAADRRSNSGSVDGHIDIKSPLSHRVNELIEWAEMRPRESIQTALRRCYEMHNRLPPLWKHNEQKYIKNDFFHGFTAPCRWDGTFPARVITGAALGTVIHPNLNRMITHREVARIMGFPDDWTISNIPQGGLAPTWGKGITVDCGRWIGGWIKNALDEVPGQHVGMPCGERESIINVTNTWQTGGRITAKPSTVARVVRTKRNMGVRMSDETVAVEGAEDVESTRRGRPRPEETITRDEQVLLLIVENDGTHTKAGLVEATGLKDSEVYLSLFRLRKDGKVYKTREGAAHVWIAGVEPEAVATEAEITA